jgi:hypothetical protein
MAYGSEDLAAFFADGVTVVCGSVTCTANLSVEDELNDLGGNFKTGVMQEKIQIELPYNAIPQLVQDTNLTVDGTRYRVREVRKIDDGQIIRVLLSRNQ